MIPSALVQLMTCAASAPLAPPPASFSISSASSVSPLAQAARNSAARSNRTLFLSAHMQRPVQEAHLHRPPHPHPQARGPGGGSGRFWGAAD